MRIFINCVFDCGQFLREDSHAMDKERLDHVRILMTTSSLVVVNVVDKILIDGVFLEVKLVEEWGFSLGEDTCLFETA